jgi:carboxymethylenebutenolidase
VTVTTRYETITASDGGEFAAFCAVPESGAGPGVLLFQGIFGINDNIRGLAGQLADAGYLALAPDVFWRLEPRFERKDESALAECMGMVQRLDFAAAAGDITAAFAHLRAMPESTGKVGAIGFCLGGTLAYLFAATARVDGRGPDAAVSYYGSGVHDMLDLAPRVECPVLFHYGARDPYIPAEKIDQVERAFADRSDVVLHRYDAGHAFSNWDAPTFFDEQAASTAWPRTLSFLAEHLR